MPVRLQSDFGQIHHIDSATLNAFFREFAPVFFLNTGRSGSGFLENVFSYIEPIRAYHEAFPNLMFFPNYAFHNQHEHTVLQKVFEASRIELMLEAFIHGKLYVETNHCLVFFVRQISFLFPKARFIHVLRHPGEFVRSAIMKGWHKNNSIWENHRIRMNDEVVWQQMSQTERLAWTWANTHAFIENFKVSTQHDVLTIKLEDLVSSKIEFHKTIQFLNAELFLDDSIVTVLQSRKINELFISGSEPPNMFKLADYPKYDAWGEDQKRALFSICNNLASRYGYTL